ncbi:hypothetical protein GGH94_000859 [Coemansia aciculifera]|uniref:GH18 domain-containing protein n=1 Tax=Coemansia aciculifera TaxID=417176 RepID=A0A9W8IMX4_9FUNG|nr:hypothetical protein GGH94_000859 [Coemansia aciculifera]KAJ2876529.1 hypothetical protein GGH93_000690 [Coemansia aciculifera]
MSAINLPKDLNLGWTGGNRPEWKDSAVAVCNDMRNYISDGGRCNEMSSFKNQGSTFGAIWAGSMIQNNGAANGLIKYLTDKISQDGMPNSKYLQWCGDGDPAKTAGVIVDASGNKEAVRQAVLQWSMGDCWNVKNGESTLPKKDLWFFDYADRKNGDPSGDPNLGTCIYKSVASGDDMAANNAASEFAEFKQVSGIKKIVSFGGWGISTDVTTYQHLRNAMLPSNVDAVVDNLINWMNTNGLDGLDIDWEYPGAPDIPGIPPGLPSDGPNYLNFLRKLKAKMPTGKSLSIAAPASYWYLKNFPIADMAPLLDYIVYMTYDLHGQWDYGNKWTDAVLAEDEASLQYLKCNGIEMLEPMCYNYAAARATFKTAKNSLDKYKFLKDNNYATIFKDHYQPRIYETAVSSYDKLMIGNFGSVSSLEYNSDSSNGLGLLASQSVSLTVTHMDISRDDYVVNNSSKKLGTEICLFQIP